MIWGVLMSLNAPQIGAGASDKAQTGHRATHVLWLQVSSEWYPEVAIAREPPPYPLAGWLWSRRQCHHNISSASSGPLWNNTPELYEGPGGRIQGSQMSGHEGPAPMRHCCIRRVGPHDCGRDPQQARRRVCSGVAPTCHRPGLCPTTLAEGRRVVCENCVMPWTNVTLTMMGLYSEASLGG